MKGHARATTRIWAGAAVRIAAAGPVWFVLADGLAIAILAI